MTANHDLRFRPHEHLRRAIDFERVYAAKSSASLPYLLVFARRNDLEHNRLGLSVSKRMGNAVCRNRIRRLFREAYRHCRNELPVAFDFVMVARTPTLPPLSEMVRDFYVVVRKAANRAS